jgi:hypothetical protein
LSTPALSAGIQQLYNKGLLPSNVSTSVLSGASPSQLNKLVSSSLALQETSTLFGSGSSSSDTADLSSTATDSLTQAVDNALTANGEAAAAQFLPQSSSAASNNTGSNSSGLINLLA